MFYTRNHYLSVGTATAIAILLGVSISGAAYNPVLALAFFVLGKFDQNMLFLYIIAEILGGLAGVFLFKCLKK